MFPSILNNFTTVSPTDRLNSPSHSGLHNTVSSAVGQIEAVIGTSSSILGTIMYDIHAPASDGGGHVQTASKGGTGQTTYTKGDILVASSPSVVSKVAIGTDGQSLVADSSVATGIKWGTPGGTKVFATASVISNPTDVETSILSTTIPGSTLGTNNAVRTTVYYRNFAVNVGVGVSVYSAVQYGGNTVASIANVGVAVNGTSVIGTLVHTMIANQTVNSQRHFLELNIKKAVNQQYVSVIGGQFYYSGTSSINSSANQTYGITIRQLSGGGDDRNDIGGVIVEKII